MSRVRRVQVGRACLAEVPNELRGGHQQGASQGRLPWRGLVSWRARRAAQLLRPGQPRRSAGLCAERCPLGAVAAAPC